VPLFPASLHVPREAGLLYLGVRSTYILGLQIGLNFVPVLSRRCIGEGGEKIGSKIEFFCRPKSAFNCWFFDIYIQGSKKIQL